MKLSSLFDPDLIVCNTKSTNREDVIAELLMAIEEKGPGVSISIINDKLAEREKISSTVMAPGIAFPHARVEGIDDFFIAIATSEEGIDFGDEKINFVALFIIKESASNLYLKTMAAVTKLLSVQAMVDKLVAADSSDDFIGLISDSKIEVEPTIRADDIMTRDIVSLKPGQSLKDAADFFVDTRHSTLLITDDNDKFLGVFSSVDLLKTGLPNYLSEMSDVAFMVDYEPFEHLLGAETSMTIEDHFSRDVKTYMDHTPVIQIAIGLIHSEAHLAPILDKEGRLVGVITITDFITKILRA
ncbi:MAG: PTS sugar transporter subunit IIA [Planctomycetota bacterium]|jgi:mannitol/fructose-specific phosphotransferase system IIA component (Ntr-type)